MTITIGRLTIYVDTDNLEDIRSRMPPNSTSQIWILSSFIDNPDPPESIPDPFYVSFNVVGASWSA